MPAFCIVPTLLRRARLVACVLALALLASLALLPPAPAEAQSVSVSNFSETAAQSGDSVGGSIWLATAFTTGGTTTDRYTLSSVLINVHNSGSGQLAVSIHNASGSNPGTKIGSDLTGTIDSDAGDTTYTAGVGNTITLNGNTTYFMQLRRIATAARSASTTASDDQTGTGGWSAATIADVGRKTSNNGRTWSSMQTSWVLRFTVNATAAAAPSLTAGSITQTGAVLTIANGPGTWYYRANKAPHNTCSSAQTGTTATLTGLTAGTSYTYKAYSDSTCATEVTSNATDADFATKDLRVSPLRATNAVLLLYSHTAAWWYKRTAPTAGSCTSVSAGTAFARLTSLSANTSYTYKAYSAAGCNAADEIASVTFTTRLAQPTLTTSLLTNVTYGSASTTPPSSGGWYWQINVEGGTALVATFTPGTASCATGTTLELGWYRLRFGQRPLMVGSTTKSSGTYTFRVTPTDANTYFAFAYCTSGAGMGKAYSSSVSLMRGGWVDLFPARDATLTAGSITQTGARLTIGNHTAAWWYKRTTPTGGTCTMVSAGTTHVDLTGLTAGTSYIFRAYSASGCADANELARDGFIAGSDTRRPKVVDYGPADGASGVARNANLVLTFNEPVKKGTG